MNNKKPILYYNEHTNRCYLEEDVAKELQRDSATPYLFLDDSENLLFVPRKEIKILYHYCTFETMMNIIKSQCLWLSNCRMSNDSEELLYSVKKLKELFLSYIEQVEKTDITDITDSKIDTAIKAMKNTQAIDDEKKELAIETLEKYRSLTMSERKEFYVNNLKNAESFVYEELKKHFRPTYITCFSEEADRLSQWRGYADDGKGVAIGFDANCLDDLKIENLFFKQIAYYPNSQKILLVEALIGLVKNKESIKNWIYNILPIIKPLGFHEEKEWRLIYAPKPEDSQLHFGHLFKENRMTYHYKLPLSKLRISEIIIGSKSRLNPIDVQYFLSSNGMQIEENQIKKSELSYR